MDAAEQRIHVLEAQLNDVLSRLALLEQAAHSSPADPLPPPRQRSPGLAEQLLQRLDQGEPAPDTVVGTFAYGGALRAPEGELVWDHERSADELLAIDLESVAQVLATLGHAVRLELMRLLLRGPLSSQQLQEHLGLASSGPLYYHLKELLAAGLVFQPSRNLYQVSHQRIVPLLAVLNAALDLRGG